MDDLDRLHDRLVSNVRGGFPHLLDRSFQLGDVGEHLVPYRLNRRELGFDSVRQFELALMRLAAGERGYLRVEPAVQDAFRRALTAPEPDAALLRDHARAAVSLDFDRPGRAEPEPAAAIEPMPVAAAEPAPPPPPPPPAPPSAAIPDAIELPPSFGLETPSWTGERPYPTASDAPAVAPTSRVTSPGQDQWIGSAGPVAPRPSPTVIGGPCRYCGHALPEGRPVTFCPHCGQNVTVRLCPACSTELEVGWHFCITCGRAMDESALGGGAA